jgi:transcriptional regulator
MHPNRAFEWHSREEMLLFVGKQVFAHIFTASDDGLFVVHAPLVVTDAGAIRFHVSRRNRIADHVAGSRVLISVAGREGYHSANWYASEDQVSTWHYEAVEIEGPARALSPEELVELLDCLSDTMERRHSPEQPWTRGKMTPGKFEAMSKAIVGFEVDPIEIRGTRKFNQHKAGNDLDASIEGQRAAGREDIVAAMRELTGHK